MSVTDSAAYSQYLNQRSELIVTDSHIFIQRQKLSVENYHQKSGASLSEVDLVLYKTVLVYEWMLLFSCSLISGLGDGIFKLVVQFVSFCIN